MIDSEILRAIDELKSQRMRWNNSRVIEGFRRKRKKVSRLKIQEYLQDLKMAGQFNKSDNCNNREEYERHTICRP